MYVEDPFEDIKAGEWVELKPPDDFPANSRRTYVDLFARAVLEGGDVPVDGRTGRRSTEIARGAYLSMQRGAPVAFPVEE